MKAQGDWGSCHSYPQIHSFLWRYLLHLETSEAILIALELTHLIQVADPGPNWEQGASYGHTQSPTAPQWCILQVSAHFKLTFTKAHCPDKEVSHDLWINWAFQNCNVIPTMGPCHYLPSS